MRWMHRTILGAGLLRPLATLAALLGALAAATAHAADPAAAPCPAPAARVTEAFLPADCSSCWAGDTPAPAPAGRAAGWRLDWITPAGDGAAMAVAALPEAADRQARAARAAATPPAGSPGQPPAPATRAARAGQAPRGWALTVATGPAWNGYMGLQMALTARAAGAASWPAGSTAWMALVEEVPAGQEGTAVARTLVRGLVGPLPLAGRQATTHLRALRLPENSRPERLAARAWIETADGRILRMAADGCRAPARPG